MNQPLPMGLLGPHGIDVAEGPRLLRHLHRGPSLDAHVDRLGGLPRPTAQELVDLARSAGLRGRGGAGFPFATKLEVAAAGRTRAEVVVNASEGEPASFKDAALALTRPHVVLDGASVTAHALGARTVHVVVPSERPAVEEAVRRAVDERSSGPRAGRRDGGLRWVVHRAEPRFVAGQARAVLELLAGRDNLPVTAWEPEAARGHRGRPTLLSNAETFAHVGLLALEGGAAYRDHGTPDEPGTLLLTVHGVTARPRVVEVPHGARWSDVLPPGALGRPVLVGGYHGTWVSPGGLVDLAVSRSVMSERGLALGAGVVIPLPEGDCPVRRTAELTAYLASQSAQRCGPCLNGLPALAEALARLDDGQAAADRIGELSRLVTRRGACAHPDGTVRMVQSMMAAFPADVLAHRQGACCFAAVPDTEDTLPLAVGR